MHPEITIISTLPVIMSASIDRLCLKDVDERMTDVEQTYPTRQEKI